MCLSFSDQKCKYSCPRNRKGTTHYLVIVVNSHVISAHNQSSHPAKLFQLARGGGEEDDLI
jgi:hypothetical protein